MLNILHYAVRMYSLRHLRLLGFDVVEVVFFISESYNILSFTRILVNVGPNLSPPPWIRLRLKLVMGIGDGDFCT